MQILLTIAYDGTNYAGWQRQENIATVQEKIEDALGEILGRETILRAASRTDAGVHALGQRASFFAEDLKIPLDKLPLVITGLLPDDISVTFAEDVPHSFSTRFHAKQKTYTYNIHNAPLPNPLLTRYAAFEPRETDLSAMQKAAALFIGKHDFTAFCAVGSSAKTTTREIFDCRIEKHTNGIISMEITGGGFLYNMVRIIAGTLLYTGLGKFPPEDIPSIIASKNRANAGKTMPPQGLTLLRVGY
jgi:tRNA pseudouridine38-40 synthase